MASADVMAITNWSISGSMAGMISALRLWRTNAAVDSLRAAIRWEALFVRTSSQFASFGRA
jgi:hypothetical protein